MPTNEPIYSGQALPGPGRSFDGPTYDYSALVGRGATLLPGDNVTFDIALPRHGKIDQQLEITEWGKDWLVLSFDEPFRYEGEEIRYCLVPCTMEWLPNRLGVLSSFCAY